MTRSLGQPSAIARWRSAYWRSVLSVFSKTCRMVDWRQVRAAVQVTGSDFLVCLDTHGFISSLPFKAMLASRRTISA